MTDEKKSDVSTRVDITNDWNDPNIRPADLSEPPPGLRGDYRLPSRDDKSNNINATIRFVDTYDFHTVHNISRSYHSSSSTHAARYTVLRTHQQQASPHVFVHPLDDHSASWLTRNANIIISVFEETHRSVGPPHNYVRIAFYQAFVKRLEAAYPHLTFRFSTG